MDFIAFKMGLQNLIQQFCTTDCTLCHHPLPLAQRERQWCVTCDEDTQRHPLGWDLLFHEPTAFRQLECRDLKGVTAIYHYQWPYDVCIQQLKFHQKLWHACTIGSLLNDQLESLGWPKFDLVCAIPLHSKRLIQRGYNQSELILDEIKCLKHIPRIAGLKRTEHRRAQSELNRLERLKNVKGSFMCEQDLSAKTVLLVDDVLTTGATLNAAAEQLLKCNATAVYAAVAGIKRLT